MNYGVNNSDIDNAIVTIDSAQKCATNLINTPVRGDSVCLKEKSSPPLEERKVGSLQAGWMADKISLQVGLPDQLESIYEINKYNEYDNTDYDNADYDNANYDNADYDNADYDNAEYDNAEYDNAEYDNAEYEIDKEDEKRKESDANTNCEYHKTSSETSENRQDENEKQENMSI